MLELATIVDLDQSGTPIVFERSVEAAIPFGPSFDERSLRIWISTNIQLSEPFYVRYLTADEQAVFDAALRRSVSLVKRAAS